LGSDEKIQGHRVSERASGAAKDLVRGSLIALHAWIFLVLIPGRMGGRVPAFLLYPFLFLCWLLLARVFYRMFR